MAKNTGWMGMKKTTACCAVKGCSAKAESHRCPTSRDWVSICMTHLQLRFARAQERFARAQAKKGI